MTKLVQTVFHPMIGVFVTMTLCDEDGFRSTFSGYLYTKVRMSQCNFYVSKYCSRLHVKMKTYLTPFVLKGLQRFYLLTTDHSLSPQGPGDEIGKGKVLLDVSCAIR